MQDHIMTILLLPFHFIHRFPDWRNNQRLLKKRQVCKCDVGKFLSIKLLQHSFLLVTQLIEQMQQHTVEVSTAYNQLHA